MFRKFLILFLILLLSSLAIAAQETGEVDPEANACNEGGSMAGKCNIDFDGNGVVDEYEIAWAWTCGWYMVRYSAGIFAEVPSFCQTLLGGTSPSNVSEGADAPTLEYCYYFNELQAYYIIYLVNKDGSLTNPRISSSPEGYPPCPAPA